MREADGVRICITDCGTLYRSDFFAWNWEGCSIPIGGKRIEILPRGFSSGGFYPSSRRAVGAVGTAMGRPNLRLESEEDVGRDLKY